MAGNLFSFAAAVTAMAMSYLIHSTLLLAAVWMFIKLLRISSDTLEESLWKWAAVTGLLTVPLQASVGWPVPWEVALAPHSTSQVDSAPRHLLLSDHVRTQFDLETHAAVETGKEISWQKLDSANPMVGRARDANDKHRGQIETSRRTVEEAKDQIDRTSNSKVTEEATVPSLSLSDNSHSRRVRQVVPWSATLLFVYVSASCVLLLLQSASLRHQFVEARPVNSGPARRILNTLLSKHAGGRRVRLMSSNRCLEPCVFGVIRWTIVLPEGAERRLSHNELRALLAHEVAHLVRGDLWWLWIGRVLCTCLAFQPLNFLARRRWKQAAEYLCDEWALKRDVTGLSLARCLTRIAQWKLDGGECSIVLPASGTKSTLVRRVERLTDHSGDVDAWATPPRRRKCFVATSIVAAIFFAVAPRVGLPSSVRTTPESSSDASVEKQVSDSLLLPPSLSLLDEELRELDADLARVNTLLDRFPSDRHLRPFTEVFEERAHQIREHRKRIVSSITKESYQ